MFVFETGDRDAGAVLFLHPLGLDHTFWRAQHEALQDCFVLAPDLPGFGHSRLEQGGLASAVDACAGVISDERCGRAVVVGISYGGYVAALLAARHADLVSGLAFSGIRRRVPRPLARLQAAMFRAVRKRDLARGQPVEDSALAAERRNLIAASRELGSVDLSPILPRITVPTVVFAPEHDTFVRREVSHVAELLPSARVVPVPAAGHLWARDQPTLLTGVVRELLLASR